MTPKTEPIVPRTITPDSWDDVVTKPEITLSMAELVYGEQQSPPPPKRRGRK